MILALMMFLCNNFGKPVELQAWVIGCFYSGREESRASCHFNCTILVPIMSFFVKLIKSSRNFKRNQGFSITWAITCTHAGLLRHGQSHYMYVGFIIPETEAKRKLVMTMKNTGLKDVAKGIISLIISFFIFTSSGCCRY